MGRAGRRIPGRPFARGICSWPGRPAGLPPSEVWRSRPMGRRMWKGSGGRGPTREPALMGRPMGGPWAVLGDSRARVAIHPRAGLELGTDRAANRRLRSVWTALGRDQAANPRRCSLWGAERTRGRGQGAVCRCETERGWGSSQRVLTLVASFAEVVEGIGDGAWSAVEEDSQERR
jgi:hypothetical protein